MPTSRHEPAPEQLRGPSLPRRHAPVRVPRGRPVAGAIRRRERPQRRPVRPVGRRSRHIDRPQIFPRPAGAPRRDRRGRGPDRHHRRPPPHHRDLIQSHRGPPCRDGPDSPHRPRNPPAIHHTHVPTRYSPSVSEPAEQSAAAPRPAPPPRAAAAQETPGSTAASQDSAASPPPPTPRVPSASVSSKPAPRSPGSHGTTPPHLPSLQSLAPHPPASEHPQTPRPERASNPAPRHQADTPRRVEPATAPAAPPARSPTAPSSPPRQTPLHARAAQPSARVEHHLRRMCSALPRHSVPPPRALLRGTVQSRRSRSHGSRSRSPVQPPARPSRTPGPERATAGRRRALQASQRVAASDFPGPRAARAAPPGSGAVRGPPPPTPPLPWKAGMLNELSAKAWLPPRDCTDCQVGTRRRDMAPWGGKPPVSPTREVPELHAFSMPW